MNTTGVVYIGIDVSKETLDVNAGGLGAMRIKNSPADIRKALGALARKAADAGLAPHVCHESTGAYTDALAGACRAAGMPRSVLNPYKVALFARAVAHAKTDRIDAAVIRRYAEANPPAPTVDPRPAVAKLRALTRTRDKLVRTAGRIRPALKTVADPDAAKALRQALAAVDKAVAALDARIAEAAAADPETAGLVKALTAIDGIGALTAAKVLGGMPGLGTLGRRKAPALAGLAPRTRESGTWKGKARTGGGRGHVREALYMPALTAATRKGPLTAFYVRLTAAGKPAKVALTAVMRKLICRMDAVAAGYYARFKKPAQD